MEDKNKMFNVRISDLSGRRTPSYGGYLVRKGWGIQKGTSFQYEIFELSGNRYEVVSSSNSLLKSTQEESHDVHSASLLAYEKACKKVIELKRNSFFKRRIIDRTNIGEQGGTKDYISRLEAQARSNE